jgi:hypothetical protein
MGGPTGHAIPCLLEVRHDTAPPTHAAGDKHAQLVQRDDE